MPPASKRRKVTATTTHPIAISNRQRGIQTIGKISKAHVQPSGKGGSKKDCARLSIDGKSSTPIAAGAKRQLEEHDEDFAEDEVTIKAAFDRKCWNTTVHLPSPPNSQDSQSICGLEESSVSSAVGTKEPSRCLPDELQDLVHLHSSFLTTLSLYLTHNGPSAPADLRELLPGVARTWGKRSATTADIQKILAVSRGTSSDKSCASGLLDLYGYNGGKICVEVLEPKTCCNYRPIDEEKLRAAFVEKLEEQWIAYQAAQLGDQSPSAFIQSLVLLPVKPCSSLTKIAPLFLKGQRTLHDLKAGAINAQKRTSRTSPASNTPIPKITSARSTDLLSRIKARQLHQSSLPLPSSPDNLARKSALQRVAEVAAVLGCLVSSSQKASIGDDMAEIFRSDFSHTSYTVPTLVQHLQMSLRNPIDKEQAVECIQLLVELAPQWGFVKKFGKTTTITVRGEGLGRSELDKRVAAMIEKL